MEEEQAVDPRNSSEVSSADIPRTPEPVQRKCPPSVSRARKECFHKNFSQSNVRR